MKPHIDWIAHYRAFWTFHGAKLPDPKQLFNAGLGGNKWRAIGRDASCTSQPRQPTTNAPRNAAATALEAMRDVALLWFTLVPPLPNPKTSCLLPRARVEDTRAACRQQPVGASHQPSTTSNIDRFVTIEVARQCGTRTSHSDWRNS